MKYVISRIYLSIITLLLALPNFSSAVDFLELGDLQILGKCFVNNQLIFEGRSKKYNFEPWITDGTKKGTKIIKDINPGNKQGVSSGLPCINSKMYFTGNIPETGAELWETDGTAEGTKLVYDLVDADPNVYSGSPSDYRIVTGSFDNKQRIVMIGNAPEGRFRLWSYDPELNEMKRIRTTASGEGFNVIYDFKLLDNNKVLFSASQNSTQRSLANISGDKMYVTDGTTEGTYALPADHLPPYNPNARFVGGTTYFFNLYSTPNALSTAPLFFTHYTISDNNGADTITDIESWLYDFASNQMTKIEVLKDAEKGIVPIFTVLKVKNEFVYFRYIDVNKPKEKQVFSFNSETREIRDLKIPAKFARYDVISSSTYFDGGYFGVISAEDKNRDQFFFLAEIEYNGGDRINFRELVTLQNSSADLRVENNRLYLYNNKDLYVIENRKAKPRKVSLPKFPALSGGRSWFFDFPFFVEWNGSIFGTFYYYDSKFGNSNPTYRFGRFPLSGKSDAPSETIATPGRPKAKASKSSITVTVASAENVEYLVRIRPVLKNNKLGPTRTIKSANSKITIKGLKAGTYRITTLYRSKASGKSSKESAAVRVRV
jgi:ELWxxDGT repeat protein